MRDSSLRRAGALCSHLWQEQEACIPHVNISGMPGLAFIKYMVTRDICMRLCAACQTEAHSRIQMSRVTMYLMKASPGMPDVLT